MSSPEIIRQKYKPKQINVLLIGESPPDGGTFFYLANSNLYRAIRNGFSQIYGSFNSDSEFLSFFQENGYYLDDLCLIPVNKLSPSSKNTERKKGIQPLSERIKTYKPKMILIVMRAIQDDVLTAIKLANVNSLEQIDVISFPSGSEKNRLDCIRQTKEALERYYNLY